MNLDIKSILDEIERIRQNGFLAVVEGKNDRIALEKLGLSRVFVLNETGKSLYERIEEIPSGETAVILTDLDKKGRKIYALLKDELSKRGVKMNNRLRDLLVMMKISHVEGLDSFVDNCQSKARLKSS